MPNKIEIMKQLQTQSRDVMRELYALALSAAPTHEELREAAKKNPLGYINSLGVLDKLAGMPQQPQQITVKHVVELTDSEIEMELMEYRKIAMLEQTTAIDAEHETIT